MVCTQLIDMRKQFIGAPVSMYSSSCGLGIHEMADWITALPASIKNLDLRFNSLEAPTKKQLTTLGDSFAHIHIESVDFLGILLARSEYKQPVTSQYQAFLVELIDRIASDVTRYEKEGKKGPCGGIDYGRFIGQATTATSLPATMRYTLYR